MYIELNAIISFQLPAYTTIYMNKVCACTCTSVHVLKQVPLLYCPGFGIRIRKDRGYCIGRRNGSSDPERIPCQVGQYMLNYDLVLLHCPLGSCMYSQALNFELQQLLGLFNSLLLNLYAGFKAFVCIHHASSLQCDAAEEPPRVH